MPAVLRSAVLSCPAVLLSCCPAICPIPSPGYHPLGVRISFSFVYGVLAQAFSVLSVVLPVLLVQLQDLVPVESTAASLSGGE